MVLIGHSVSTVHITELSNFMLTQHYPSSLKLNNKD